MQIVRAAYHVPSGSHEQFAAVEVLAHLLGTQPAGRLYKNVVETGLAADTSISTSPWKEPGVLLAGAEVRREGDLGEAVEAMLATLEGLDDEPPTAQEVDRAKAELAAGFEHVFNDPNAIGGTLGHWAAVGDWRLMFLHRDRVAEVTPDDDLAVAKAYLKTSNRTVGYFYPTDETPPRAEVPAPPDVAALVAGYTGGRTVAEGEAFEPTPANIESRTTTLTLASGVEVALLPKESRDDAVSDAEHRTRMGPHRERHRATLVGPRRRQAQDQRGVRSDAPARNRGWVRGRPRPWAGRAHTLRRRDARRRRSAHGAKRRPLAVHPRCGTRARGLPANG